MKTECDKLKIAEYAKGRVTGSELVSIEAHLAECPECTSFLKLQNALNGWVEEGKVNPDFDSSVIGKARELIARRKKFALVFTSTFRAAAACAVLLAVVTTYRNTLYDDVTANLESLSSGSLDSKIEIKDVKLYVTYRLCREMTSAKLDQKSMMNYEMLLAVPENILVEEQKNDVAELLKQGVKERNASRNIVLRALDTAVSGIEKGAGVSFAFASTGNRAPSDIYKQATLDLEEGKFESALDGYLKVASAEDDSLSCSALFRTAYLNDLLQRHDEAAGIYKSVCEKYSASSQAVMAAEMGRFAVSKKRLVARLEELKGDEGRERDRLAIAGLQLALFDLKSAAASYAALADVSEKAKLFAGWCFKAQGNYSKASEYFASLKNDREYSSLAAYELSLAYLKLGDKASAGKALENKTDNADEVPVMYNKLIEKYFKAVGK